MTSETPITSEFSVPEHLHLFPPNRHPYYIVTPPYTRFSAGIKALHLLCHALNRQGQNAFLIFKPAPRKRPPINPDLLTPVLTSQVALHHYEHHLTPVVVYPEIVTGNPLNAPFVTRYVLNFPGLIGGDKSYPSDELVFAYSSALAAAAGVPAENVMFIPASDTRIFYPGKDKTRAGSCYVADKYQGMHGGKLFDITQDSIEITRNKPDSQSPEQLADLFRRSEVLYAYENTALAIEAMLCGCPTVFLPNPHLKGLIAVKELGMDGFAWGNHPAEVARAKETVGRAHRNYFASYERFWDKLNYFISVTQQRAMTTPYTQPIREDAFRPSRLSKLIRRLLSKKSCSSNSLRHEPSRIVQTSPTKR